MTAIPQKQGQARAVSLQTLLDHRSELSTLEVSQWSTLFASLPDVFKLLTLHDQLFLLDSRWKPIASSATLKNVAELHMSAEVEEVALASLDDKDSEVKSSECTR